MPRSNAATRSWTIEVSDDFDSRWLPTPYPVFSINAPGDWRYDRRTLDFISAAEDQSTAGLRYELEGVSIAPTAEQLIDSAPAPADIFGPSTEVPDGTPEIVRRLAREVTADATNKLEQARALQDWFQDGGGFEYSVQRAESGNGSEDLERFLSPEPGGRVGYCEQFASSMALMSRTLGIPARVAVGFLRPERVGRDTYVYSARDLHAWPELYFEGVGWLLFEPTPLVRTNEVPAYTRGEADPGSQPDNPRDSATAGPNVNRFDQPSETADPTAAGGSAGTSGGTGLLLGFGGSLLALGLLAAPRALREVRRRRRWSAAVTPAGLAEAAWAELRDTAVDLRVAWSDSVTLRTRARELVRSFARPGGGDDALARATERGPEVNPEATQALERLVHRLEVARYARSAPATGAQRAEMEADVALCAGALRDGAGRGRRTRARWLPASLRGWLSIRRPVRRTGPAFDGTGVDHAV